MSEDRMARLAAAKAVGATAAASHPADKAAISNRLGAELVHVAAQLKPHGISIVDLLGMIAKAHYGVTISPYVPPKDEPAETEKAA